MTKDEDMIKLIYAQARLILLFETEKISGVVTLRRLSMRELAPCSPSSSQPELKAPLESSMLVVERFQCKCLKAK